jgi:tRNA pseudouridine32 synthase/23S rRNA pseudouridine746 synthase
MIDYQPPAHTGLDILYQDDDFIIVNKPAELLSVPGRGEHKQDCMISRVQVEYPQALITHRLDMSTSGILIIALGAENHRLMSQMFEKRQVEKRYTAIIDGRPAQAEGQINQPLICDWPNRPRHKIDYQLGKPSRTLYKVLSYDEVSNTSRVELTPVTGRTHQLRVHMQSIGHPILGDSLYASEDICNKADRLLLHASHIRFKHPVSDKYIDVDSPADF